MEQGIDSFFQKIEILKCPSKHAFYVKGNDFGDVVLFYFYVGDLIIVNNTKRLKTLKLHDAWVWNDTSWPNIIFSWHVNSLKGDDEIFICQKRYVVKLFKKFDMHECNMTRTPMKVGMKLFNKGDEAHDWSLMLPY